MLQAWLAILPLLVATTVATSSPPVLNRREYLVSEDIPTYIVGGRDEPATVPEGQNSHRRRRQYMVAGMDDFSQCRIAWGTGDAWNAYVGSGFDFFRRHGASSPKSNQTFLLSLNSGSDSGIVWVPGPNVKPAFGNKLTTCDARRFDPTASRTIVSTGEPFTSINADGGTTTGTIYEDYVGVGGIATPGFKFGVADSSDAKLTEFTEGSMGLNTYANCSLPPPLWYSLVKTHNYSLEGFSLYQKRDNELLYGVRWPVERLDTEVPGGTMTIGGWNTTFMKGDFVEVAAAKDVERWQVPLGGFKLNNKALHIGCPEVVLDTSGVLTRVDSKTVDKLYAMIPGAVAVTTSGGGRRHQVPCCTDVTLEVVFKDVSFALQPSDFIQVVDESACYGTVVDNDPANPDLWRFGEAVLRNIYTRYQRSPKRTVSFAHLKPEFNEPVNPSAWAPFCKDNAAYSGHGVVARGSCHSSKPKPPPKYCRPLE